LISDYVDLPRDVALEAGEELLVGLAFLGAAFHVNY
jgi:hypothetical protein